MKKVYIIPELIEEKMDTQELLVSSPVTFDGEGSGGINPIDEDPDDGDAMGREYGDFDMDDEEF